MNRFFGKTAYKLNKYLSKKIVLANRNYNFRNFYNSDCVAVFPEIGVCFNRIKKSGNTSTCAYLSEICGYVQSETTSEMKNRIRSPSNLSLMEMTKLRNYHSLLVVRNPYARTLSAFLDKVGPGKNKIFSACPGFGDPSASGFCNFLVFLEDGGTVLDRHLWPQVDLLYQPAHDFSYIAKLETLSADLNEFLYSIGVPAKYRTDLNRPHRLEAAEPGKITNADTKIFQYYDRTSANIVERIYSADFEILEYNQTWVNTA